MEERIIETKTKFNKSLITFYFMENNAYFNFSCHTSIRRNFFKIFVQSLKSKF